MLNIVIACRNCPIIQNGKRLIWCGFLGGLCILLVGCVKPTLNGPEQEKARLALQNEQKSFQDQKYIRTTHKQWDMVRHVGKRLDKASQPLCMSIDKQYCAFELVLVNDKYDDGISTIEDLQGQNLPYCEGVDIQSNWFPDFPPQQSLEQKHEQEGWFYKTFMSFNRKKEPACIVTMEKADNNNSSPKIGFVLVPISFLYHVASDNELAAVMGHEFAHHICGHVRQTEKRENDINTIRLADLFVKTLELIAATRGNYISSSGNYVNNYATTLESTNKDRNRDEELEADYIGAFLVSRAGYNLDSAVRTWSKILKREFEGETGAVGKRIVVETHPPAVNRIVIWQEVAAKLHSSRNAQLPTECHL